MAARQSPIRCALLSARNEGWLIECLFACKDISLHAFPGGTFPAAPPAAPLRLPVLERPDVVLVSTDWYLWLARQGPDAVEDAFRRLRRLCDVIVGIEGHDAFALWMPPDGVDRVDLLVKTQGLFRDRDLYNFKVGPLHPGANWTRKTEPTDRPYSPRQLDKLRLSFPCFIAVDRRVRARIRRKMFGFGAAARAVRGFGDLLSTLEGRLLGSLIVPEQTAQCLVSLTHITRLELLIALREARVSGQFGVASVTELIGGTERGTAPATPAQVGEIRDTLRRHGLLHPGMSRYQFKRSLLRHKAVIAPAGYGELTLRHADAWEQSRALVCPGLDHVETMFPFERGRNVLFCKPDYSDILPLLEDIRSGRVDHAALGLRGNEDWRAWIQDVDGILSRGVTAHLREALARPFVKP